MKKDQMLTRRRVLLAGAAVMGAAGTADLFLTGRTGTAPARSGAPAAGPGARAAVKSSVFRLRPLTGDGPARTPPARTPVRKEPILRMPGTGRRMLLTFDDGPDPAYTPHILDTLAKYDVRATFFVCGEMAEWNGYLLARMADEGHVVGNHTWSHPRLTELSRAQIRSEMERTSEAIAKGYGEHPRWFRAPYGAWNRAAFQLGAEMGMEPLAWTVDSLDWTKPGTRTIIDRIERGAAPGVVVLSHDAGGDRSQSVGALRRYLPWLLDNGYHLIVPKRPYG
ncbi:polysaccharide deacetylase family protein [Streptomyces sp. NPDC004629]|uniref:polysaccharide deacetylase family protein n=1 Tax=Streptomyces sp. NPDC004629 TaxID=3364705 RepID=UPI0036943642